jgi:putative membrane protein
VSPHAVAAPSYDGYQGLGAKVSRAPSAPLCIAAVFYLFATAMHSGALGALLTFAPSPWYPAYEGATAAWGLTPLEDQQLAGLIMWIPAGLSYLVAGLALTAAWLREAERRNARWQERALLRPTG